MEINIEADETGPTAPKEGERTEASSSPKTSDAATASAQEGSSDTAASEGTNDALLAGKFKTPEDLEKAYKELESKLGGEQKSDETKDEDESEKQETDSSQLFREATKEEQQWSTENYGEGISGIFDKSGLNAKAVFEDYSKTGTLSEEVYKAFEDKGGVPRDAVDRYIANSTDQGDAVLMGIAESVGGVEAYNKMIDWMEQSIPATDFDKFSGVIDAGDPDAIQFAVDAMHNRYKQGVGHEPDLLGKGAPTAVVDGFKSTAEAVAARNDPRFTTDEAYRAEYSRKLSVSSILDVR